MTTTALKLQKRLLVTVTLLLLTACQVPAATSTEPKTDLPDGFSTNLPLILIDTPTAIVDEPKVTGEMRVINAGNVPNTLTGESEYDGAIGIEIRGQTSQQFPKKQYSLETRDADGDNNNVSLLGMPEENDWILHAPYSDKSLMRNLLAYDLARLMGRYASRAEFAEVVLNGEYQGVYVLLEKIKRDKNRINIEKNEDEEDDITGGYILELTQAGKLDKGDAFFTTGRTDLPFIYEYPSGNDLSDEAASYIENYVNELEAALYGETFTDPETGYRAYIDVDAAIDYMLVQELFKNRDAFSASTFFYKDAGGKLVFGPLWDFNITSGNDNLETRRRPRGWRLTQRPWTEQLLKDPYFVELYVARWNELKEAGVFTDLIIAVDTQAELLVEAQQRNFEKWPVLGEVIKFNPPGYTYDTYEEEITYLKDWLTDRITWMDANIGKL